MAILTDRVSLEATNPQPTQGPHSIRRALAAAGIVVVALMAIFAAVAPMLSSMARSRIQDTLQESFASDLQIQNLKVSLFPSVGVSGESVVFRRKGHPSDPPLIQIARFTARGNIFELLARHLSLVHLEGLDIHVPPKRSR